MDDLRRCRSATSPPAAEALDRAFRASILQRCLDGLAGLARGFTLSGCRAGLAVLEGYTTRRPSGGAAILFSWGGLLLPFGDEAPRTGFHSYIYLRGLRFLRRRDRQPRDLGEPSAGYRPAGILGPRCRLAGQARDRAPLEVAHYARRGGYDRNFPLFSPARFHCLCQDEGR